MKKRGIVFLLIFSLLLLVSCSNIDLDGKQFFNDGSTQTEEPSEELVKDEIEIVSEDIAVVEEVQEVQEVQEVLEEEEEFALACSDSSECAWNEYCIEGECGTVSTIYDTDGDCEVKCNFDQVEVLTSDAEELILSRGRGSYTAAGAIEWKLLSSSDYCKGDDATPVAIELTKRNTGKVLAKEVIVLDLGETSTTITHPSISRVSFTLEVQDYVETCE